MSCDYCEHKGYVVDNRISDNGYKKIIMPCPQCEDKEAYNKKIKEMYAPKYTECKIIQFPKKYNATN